MFNDMGIPVYETAPEADALLLSNSSNTDDDAAEEAAEALASVDSEFGRTTDPVRMYMREMGTVELLTREGEIVIAKRIEEGIRQVMHALAYWPGAVTVVLSEYAKVDTEERRLTDIISGYLDQDDEPMSNPPQATSDKTAVDNESDDDDEDSQTQKKPLNASQNLPSNTQNTSQLKTNTVVTTKKRASHSKSSANYLCPSNSSHDCLKP